MKNFLIFFVLIISLYSCSDVNDKHKDQLIVTDTETGIRYKLVLNVGDNFRVLEETIKIVGPDTVTVFE